MISRVFKKAFANVTRSGWRAFMITFMMTITYTMLGLLLLVLFFSTQLARFFVEKPEIIGFFNEGVEEEKILEVKNELENKPFVVEVSYVSKEEALESFIEENKDNQEVLENLTVNPFPAHLNVKVDSLDKIEEIANYFNNNDKISDVIDSLGVVDTLRKIVTGIQIFGIGLLVIFSFATFMLVFLAIGLTIYSQRDELRVMKLVGASNWYTRGPYIVQSLLYGIVSSLIACLIVGAFIYFQYNNVVSSLLGALEVKGIGLQDIIIGFSIQIMFAVFLSWLSSYIATKRYISY